MSSILGIAKHYRLKVIEDAAHALPATWNGQRIGSLQSDATVFRFYATKTLATGEGGMIVTRDAALARGARTMRLHGIDRDAFDRYTSKTPGWFYRVVAPGFKYNMTDLAAAIGIHQLRKLERFACGREEASHAVMMTRFNILPLQLPAHAPAGDTHAHHLYVVRLNDDASVSRDDFIAEMASAGIGTSVHFIPLHLHPYWRDTYKLGPSSSRMPPEPLVLS